MKITSFIRRTIASVLLTAGLVYPACAAICPKGIGGCPSPGRCFLFIDADGNSLCDYTSRFSSSTSSATAYASPVAPQNSASSLPASVPSALSPANVQGAPVIAAPDTSNPVIAASRIF